jgi:hypothetical protein
MIPARLHRCARRRIAAVTDGPLQDVQKLLDSAFLFFCEFSLTTE